MGGVWRYVLFTLLLTTVVGALTKKSLSKSSSKTDTSQQAEPVVEIIIGENSTLAEGEYMTKRTGKSGDSLIIGSYSPPLDDDYLTRFHYVCELANENGLYNEKIEPEIYKRTSDSYEMTGAEEKQKQDLSENFIRIKMEIWKCSKSQIRRTHNFFYFIRNEFISFKEIRDIKYVAGVEVSLIDYSSDVRRVKVVETKYYYRIDHTVHSNVYVKASALNFELQLQVRDRQTTYPRPGFAFEVKSPDVSRRKSDVSRRKSDVSRRESDVSRRESDVSRQSVRSQESSGFLFLRLGPSATPNTDIITAECEPIQGMNPALRRPEVFKVFNSSKQGSAPNEDQNIYARLSDKEFDDHFIITKRKFWKCRPTPTTTTTTSKSTSKGKTSESEPISFHRVMHEVVGRKKVNLVLPGFGIEEIVSVQIPNQEAKTVLFTIVDHFYMHDLSRITKAVTPIFKKQERLTAIIKSSSDSKEIIDVNFRLSKQALVFRTWIGDGGYDLRVGSEVKSQYNIDRSSVIKCSKTDYLDGYETNFKIIMKTDNKFHKTSDVLDKASKYYKYLSKNAWKCIEKDTKVPRYEFMRVVNELQVLVKVNEIETFDGVEIFYDGSDVKLVETKYLSSNEYDSIRFDHTIELEEEKEAKPDSARAENSSAKISRQNSHLVSKTNDEIVTWFDHHSNTIHAFKIKDDPSSKWLKLFGTGLDDIEFTYITEQTNTPSTDAGRESIYICEPKDNPQFKPMALYDVYSNGDRNTRKYQQMDSEVNEYFTDIDFEVQVCDQMEYNQQSNTYNLRKQIYRVVSEQTLKDEKVTAVSTVSYDGVLRDVGWFETATNENQYKLKLKTFRYYDYSETGSNPSLHKVSDDETLLLKPVPQPTAGWKSGSTAVENIDQKREEILVPTRINYLKRLHETEIPEFSSSGIAQFNKVSLIIGSKWTKVFGSYEMEMDCNFQEDIKEEKYETEMKTRNGSRVEIKYYLQDWYQEVWECTRATGSTESDTADKMYRVVNEYSVESKKLNSLDVLYNYDGVTIYRTEPKSSTKENIRDKIIIFVKEIKYIHEGSVVKFEGVIKLTRPNHSGTGDDTKLALPHSPHRFRESYRRDILLPKINVVFQTVVVNPRAEQPAGSKRIYEFGENTQEEIKQEKLPYMKCQFKSDTVNESGKTQIDWNLMTKASLYRMLKEGGGTDRLSYDNKNPNMVLLFSLENFNQRIWNCEREINGIKYNYKRVQNEFRIDFEASGNKGNALIYHYEGVTVTRDGVVREVKYYNAESKSIRYDGVVWLIEPTGEEATGLVGSILDKLHLDDKSGREVYYYLDKPMLQFRSVNGEGRLVQFGKPAESDRLMKVVEPTPGKPVTCTTYSDYLEDSRFPTATELFTTFQSEQQQTNFASWIMIIPGKEETRAYTYKNSRSIWECKREQDKQLFLRVENIYVPSYILYPMDKLFVADGLSLKTILLPDKSDNFLITEVKYFEQKRNAENELTSLVPVKYDGEVILVVEKPSTIMKRLYPSTSDYELAGSDTNGKYWSIDALKTQLRKIKQVLPIEEILKEDATVKKGRRTYKNGAAYRRSLGAAENTKSPPKTSRRNSMVRSVAAVTKGVANAVTGSKTETGKKELPGVIYIKKGKVYAIALGGRGRRIFHIAADDWTEKADENGYLCIQDIWSPKDRLRFIPKVIERIDDYNYELNGEALSKLFKVEQEVHFCAAKYKFAKARVLTRVTTTLEADANGINAVSYSGSSRVDTFEQQDGKNNAKRTVIKVTIDTFIEENSSAIYKSDTPISQYETKLSQNVLSRLASIINPK